MSKYTKWTLNLKLKAVQSYLNDEGGYEEIAKKFDIAAWTTVRKWGKKYEEHGEKGLIKNFCSSYSVTFKQNVIEYMHTNSLSYQETAHHFNLGSVSIISRWERIYYEEGVQSFYQERRNGNKNMNSNVTEFKVHKEKLYLSPIIDLFLDC